MTKTALALVLLLLAAAPAFAQANELGVAVGVVDRVASKADENAGLKRHDLKLAAAVKEAWFAVQLDPGTRFKLKAGRIDSQTVFITNEGRTRFPGHTHYVDGLVDYRFSEPYGSTGIFGGIGAYRQHGAGHTETAYGFSVGVNGDFPLSPRYGIVVEAAYHWTHFQTRPQFLTATGGLRVAF
jgi:hypothetical protein